MEQHLKWLGVKVTDSLTEMKGIVSSISFDMNGCVQAFIHQQVDDKGIVPDGRWVDVTRLTARSMKPVCTPPDFISGYPGTGKKGACEKGAK